ncbi:unnamed protein product [Zymoseptoria tritici ST99CH_1E4]|uniref:Uncharacterized protein n=1 Tax=Zymoseptoria tritici ST99CH_1E4 TaxID=1276532 RepID=A0A2H1H9V3_ZYMTR|nr:unnamed protein product [Zymoseptoria tritici ST99CH_1E4]
MTTNSAAPRPARRATTDSNNGAVSTTASTANNNDSNIDLALTNDAATILRELEVVHPASKLPVMASRQQEAEMGDATNMVIVFAGELPKKAEELLQSRTELQGETCYAIGQHDDHPSVPAWTGSQPKAFLDCHHISNPPPHNRDSLLSTIRSNHQSIATKAGGIPAYPGDWLCQYCCYIRGAGGEVERIATPTPTASCTVFERTGSAGRVERKDGQTDR